MWDNNFSRAQHHPSPSRLPTASLTHPTDRPICEALTPTSILWSFFSRPFGLFAHQLLDPRPPPPLFITNKAGRNIIKKNVFPPYRRPGPRDLDPPCHHRPVDCRRPPSGHRSSYLHHLDAPAKRAPGGVFRGVQRQVRHDLLPLRRPQGTGIANFQTSRHGHRSTAATGQ